MSRPSKGQKFDQLIRVLEMPLCDDSKVVYGVMLKKLSKRRASTLAEVSGVADVHGALAVLEEAELIREVGRDMWEVREFWSKADKREAVEAISNLDVFIEVYDEMRQKNGVARLRMMNVARKRFPAVVRKLDDHDINYRDYITFVQELYADRNQTEGIGFVTVYQVAGDWALSEWFDRTDAQPQHQFGYYQKMLAEAGYASLIALDDLKYIVRYAEDLAVMPNIGTPSKFVDEIHYLASIMSVKDAAKA